MFVHGIDSLMTHSVQAFERVILWPRRTEHQYMAELESRGTFQDEDLAREDQLVAEATALSASQDPVKILLDLNRKYG